MVLLLEVRQFVHDNHPEEFFRRSSEDRCHPDLVLGLESAPLHPGDEGVASQGVLDDVHLAIVGHFAQWLRGTDEFVFDTHCKVVEGLVGTDVMGGGIFSRQQAAKPVLRNQLLHLGDDLFRIACQVFQFVHFVLPAFSIWSVRLQLELSKMSPEFMTVV